MMLQELEFCSLLSTDALNLSLVMIYDFKKIVELYLLVECFNVYCFFWSRAGTLDGGECYCRSAVINLYIFECVSYELILFIVYI